MRRVVVWGGTNDKHSHRHIHRAFFENARKLGYTSSWVEDRPGSRTAIAEGSIVIAADVWSMHLGAPVPGADYVLHNFDGSHPLCRQLDPQHLLRLQVYTKDAAGERWAAFRHFQREGQVLFQPWGCDLLPEEFLDPVYNPRAQDVTFVGAIWSDIQQDSSDLGNYDLIQELKLLCADRALRFRHLTHISDNENIEAVRTARLAPAFAGGWQVAHNYLPCRAFKNPAYGALAVCNVPAVQALYGSTEPGACSVAELLDAALHLKRNDYLELVREQQKVAARYTYRESLQAIERALAEIKT